MGLVLAALFIAVPALEIALLVKVGGIIGAGWTFAVVVATGVAGAAVAKQQGLRALREVQEAMSTGRRVGVSLVAAALLLVAAVLLVTPGFVTDAVGLVLLIPWLRQSAAHALVARFAANVIHVRGVAADPNFGAGDEPPPPGVIDV